MNTNKEATGSAWKSRRLLAALAVLAVAFVVLAAVPAVATDSDADGDSTATEASTGIIAYGSLAGDGTLAHNESIDSIINAISGTSVKDSQGNTAFVSFYTAANEKVTITSGETTVGDHTFTTAGAHAFTWTSLKQDDGKNGYVEGYNFSKDYAVSVKIGDADVVGLTIQSGVISLYQDVKTTSTVSISGEATLDLNGHTIQATGADTITVASGASLEVIDSSSAKTGKVDAVTDDYAAIYNNGTIVLNGGTYTRSTEANNNSYYVILNHGTMTINAGVTVEVGEYNEARLTEPTSGNLQTSSLIENGYYNYSSNNARSGYVKDTNSEAPSLTINGGTFNNGMNTVKNDDGATVTFNGGTVNNSYQVALQNHNIATINGGSFTSTTQAAVQNCGCGATYDVGQLTINGGTFKGVDGYGQIWDDSSVSSTVTIGKNVSVSVLNDDQSVKSSAKAYDATKATMILSEGSSVQFITGSLLPSKITYSASTTDVSTASFTSVKAGTAGVTVSAGSIEINGQLVQATSDGTITVTGDAVVTGDSTIDSGVTLIIADDATLTVQDGVTLTVNGKIQTSATGGNGKLVVDGELTTTNKDPNGQTVDVSTLVSVSDISYGEDAMKTATISEGDELQSATYGAAQRVEVKGNATVTGKLTINGILHINEGVTLTIAAGGEVVIQGGNTSIIEGTLVLEETDGAKADANMTVAGSAVLQIKGHLNVAGDLVVKDSASIQFMTGSDTEVGGNFSAAKAVIEADASLTVAGAVKKVSDSVNTLFEVAGTLVIESEDKSDRFTVDLTADGAVLDIQSVAMADNGTIEVQDKGTVELDSRNAEPTAAAYNDRIIITLKSIAGKIMPTDRQLTDDDTNNVTDLAVLTGLKVTESMVSKAAVAATSTAAAQAAKHIYTAQLSGTVAVDQVIVYTGIGTAVGYATAEIEVTDGTTVEVKESLAIGAGVTLTNAGTLKVSAAVDATASSSESYVDVSSATEDSTDSANVLWDSKKYKDLTSSTKTLTASIVNTNGKIELSSEGSITAAVAITGIGSSTFSGAYYETSVTVGSAKVTTYHYVTVDAALAALTAGTTDDVTLYGAQTVGANATILSKDTITLGDAQTKLTIGKDATLTVADGGKLVATTEDSIVVKGTLHVDVYKQFVSYTKAVDSDVYSYAANAKGVQDNSSWAEWTSIKNALDKAESGQTVTVNPNKETVEIGEDTKVKEGVTLDANGKTISVKQTYALTVNGTLDLTKSGSSLTLAAKTAAQAATSTTPAIAAVAGGAVVYDSGIIKYTDDSQIVRNGANLPGAYYSMTDSGKTVKYLASYAQGAKDIASAVGRAVTFSADGASAGVVISSDLAITGEKDKAVALTITGAKLTAGTITLSYATVDVASGTVSATFASADGSAKVAGAATSLKAVHDDYKVGDDTVTALQISGTLSDVAATTTAAKVTSSAVLSGIVYIVGTMDAGSTLTVSEGANVTVAGSADVDAKTLTVAGNLVVLAGNVDAKTATISGALVAQGGVVALRTATVSGSIDASNKNTSGSYTGTVTLTTAYIGTTEAAVLGADVSLVGNVVLDSTSGIAYVAPSATVPSEWTASSSVLKTTKFVDENGADYLTVYTVAEDAVAIYKIEKSVTDAEFVGWTNSKGEVAAEASDDNKTPKEVLAYVGDSGWTTVTAKIDVNVFKVTIITDGTVSSVTLGGILLDGDKTFTSGLIKAGTYTVAYSAGAGYDVSGMKLSTADGTAVSGFEIIINDSTTSSDRTVTYQLTGGKAASTSGGSSSGTDVSGIIDAINKNTDAVKNQDKNITVNGSDDDNDLTNILLVVLVILIIVMAILVAMRMMRS